MARKRNGEQPGYGRILDAWVPPEGAGEAIGCFATTFTFQPAFFETECLGRMLQLESDPDTNSALYFIEREESMARLVSASVVVDQVHARGSRSLRWDLIPFRSERGILHAKLSILLWQHVARLIVSSANLTEPGYRRNLEVFTVWDFHREGRVPAALFGQATEFASEILTHCRSRNPAGSPAVDRSVSFLAEAGRQVARWLPADTPMPRFRSALVALTPRSGSVFEQVQSLWPGGSPAISLHVLSPFFDNGVENLPARAVWSLLRQRGDVGVFYSVAAEPIGASGQLQVHAPSTLRDSQPDGREGRAHVMFDRIRDLGGRALHAKSLWMQDESRFLHLIGSSNFTAAGLGLSNGGRRNWELNVTSWAKQDEDAECRRRNAAWPRRDDDHPIEPAKDSWQPLPALEDEGEGSLAILPRWCGSAVYFLATGGRAALELNFVGDVPLEWSIHDESGNRILLDHAGWCSAKSPSKIEIAWPESRPPTEILIRMPELPAEVHWPVEVRAFADLPPPQELRDLTLEQLLEILTSALPLHRCLQKLARRESAESDARSPALMLDPLRRFSRETHLLERTRRFSLAMAGLKRRLERPISSEEFLQWRLYGPIGVAKVAAAILKEAGSDGEKAFLLGELALELSQVQPANEMGCLSRARVREAIGGLIAEFRKQAEPLLAATDPALKGYVEHALETARS